MRYVIPLLAAATLIAADTPPKARLAESQSIQPKSYRVELTLDPSKTGFSGSIGIELEIARPTRTIWLNQNRLTISNATVNVQGKKIQGAAVPGGDDFVGLRFPADIPAGAASLTIEYTGIVNSKNTAGIFRGQDNDSWYILKTPWQLTLHIPASDTAVSNTPGVSEKVMNGTKTVVFGQTKPLPSYLVAFGVDPLSTWRQAARGVTKSRSGLLCRRDMP